MAIENGRSSRSPRSEDPKGDGLKLLAELTGGESHDYPACAIYRGGMCTCDERSAKKELTDKQIEDAVFAVLRRWKDDRAWERYTRESGPYDVSSLRPEVLEIIRAVLAANGAAR